MAAAEPPGARRYTGTGTCEGLTLIYYADGRVITYETGSPAWYAEAFPAPDGEFRPAARREMSPEDLARFEAIPLCDGPPLRDVQFPVADEDVTFADPHGGTGLDEWE